MGKYASGFIFENQRALQVTLDKERLIFYTQRIHTCYFAGVAQGLRSYPLNLIRIIPAEGIAEISCRYPVLFSVLPVCPPSPFFYHQPFKENEAHDVRFGPQDR